MYLVAVGLIACSAPTTPLKRPEPVGRTGAPSRIDGLEPPMPMLRLPRNFLPTSYAATLAIDPARSGFDGTIAITGNVSERSSVLWLHGDHLTIKHAVATRGGAETQLTATSYANELLKLRARAPLEAGTWTLTIDYTGTYDESYTTGASKQTVRAAPYVYTQLEPIYARRVFPCLDEPDNKVPWKLTLDVPAKLIAVSNTPVVQVQLLGADKKRVEFAVTKPLPTYLVAFGVGPFDVVDAGKTTRGTQVRIITMQDRAPDAAWAARTTARLVDLVEELFGSPYPYEKIDMLAIPVTGWFGAMEHPGLITFAEKLILLDPKHAAKGDQYAWVDVAAHELAHQWVGDLVTMAWWDDAWLNEGFARWAEHKISARFEPAWHEELSEVGMRNAALDYDGLVNARQVRQPIATHGDILDAFDRITYDKAASVLNMFEGYLGHDVFLRGVREYLKQYAFGNVTSTELVSAISKAAGQDLEAAFATFLEQPGAPEITATLVCESGQAPRVALSQHRYVPPGSPAPPAGKPWIVPVCVAFDRGGKRAEACSLLAAATGSIALDTPSCPRWMMPNVDGRGHYRNTYTAAQAVALRDDAWPQLRSTERRVVVFDASNAATLGKLPLQLALSFVPRLLAAGDRSSISAALEIPLGARTLVPDELRLTYEAWLRRTFGVAAREAGLTPKDSDSLEVESVRRKLITVVAEVGRDPALITEAVRLAGTWRELPSATRGQVLALAAHASPVVFNRLLKEVYTEQDRLRRQEIVSALASTHNLQQQQAALELILDPRLDPEDTQYVFSSADTEANHATAQRFFIANMTMIRNRIPSHQFWFAHVFTSSCEEAHRDELVDFLTRRFSQMQGRVREVQLGIERMDQCIARRKLVEPELRSWLAGPPPPGSPAASVIP